MTDSKDAEDGPHFWIGYMLADIEDYARTHDLPRIAELVHNARHAVHVVLELERCDPELHDIKEEQWVDVALEGLAQYCQSHGYVAMRTHLLAALKAWHEACASRRLEAKVHTLPLRKLPPRD